MAKTFKPLHNDDIATTRTLLHEAIPVTGGIVTGALYDEVDAAVTNVKNYDHEMFQSVYDYTHTKSASNHILDITVGINAASLLNNGISDLSVEKKQIIYNEFAQILAGHDISGNINSFDADGDLTSGSKHNECYVISIARLLNKDEVKKGSFYMKLNVQPNAYMATGVTGARQELLISDEGSENTYKVNSPAGDYGILKCRTFKHYEGAWAADKKTFTPSPVTEVYTVDYDATDTAVGESSNLAAATIDSNVGLIFYQTGVVILSPNVFVKHSTTNVVAGDSISLKGVLPGGTAAGGTAGVDSHSLALNADAPEVATGATGPITSANLPVKLVEESFKTLNIPKNCDGLRNRIHQIAFNNTTELNSTIYFCRVNHNDFNYSSNPTYLDGGKIRVKQSAEDSPVSYITSVGLYSANNELLAVAKLSEPLRKDPTNEMVLRVRLDY